MILVAECARLLPESRMISFMKESLDQYKLLLPLVQDLRNENLKSRHWTQIWTVVGQSFPIDATFTVQRIFNMKLLKCIINHCCLFTFLKTVRREISEISGAATQQSSLEASMSKIIQR